MEPYLEAMGGRDEVVRLLSGPRAQIQVNAPLALLQQGMECNVNLMARLYGEGMLNSDQALADQIAQVESHIRANRTARTNLETEAARLGKRQADLLRRAATKEGDRSE
jgi:hypothetical protein